jgi:hypothetical protein
LEIFPELRQTHPQGFMNKTLVRSLRIVELKVFKQGPHKRGASLTRFDRVEMPVHFDFSFDIRCIGPRELQGHIIVVSANG